MRSLILIAVITLAACGSGPSQSGWTGQSAQPFDTAVAACRQISGGNTANYYTCMAGRGWTRIQK